MTVIELHNCNNNRMHPVFQRIKVLPDIPADRPRLEDDGFAKTKQGIYIPPSATDSVASLKVERQVTGVIVAIGENVEALPVGARVLYGEYSGKLRWENESGEYDSKCGIGYRYMNEADVIAVLISKEEANNG